MSSPANAPRDLEDRVLRESLKEPANQQAFLRRVVPQFAEGFDYERVELLKRELVADDWRHREADLPFQIPYRTGNDEIMALVYVLIEHQSNEDPMMPLRKLYFAAAYWDSQWREWAKIEPPRPAFRLHPILPIVLYTGNKPWASNRTLADMLGEPAEIHAFAPTWQPLFWYLSEQTPESLLSSGEGWLQMRSQIGRCIGVRFDKN